MVEEVCEIGISVAIADVVDVVAIVDVVDFLGEHMNKYKDVKWQVVDKSIDTWYCGIGVKKGNYTLQQWLNVAIYTMHRDDFVDKTWKKWFGIGQLTSVQATPYF